MQSDTKEDKLLLAMLADRAEQCRQRQYCSHSDFLDTHQQTLAEAEFRNTPCCFWGGFPEAERRLLVFLPDYLTAEAFLTEPDGDMLAVLRARPTARCAGLSHRDYLGALLSLGIKREKLGDILVNEAWADIIVLKELADYLLLNFQRAGRFSLSLELLPVAVLSSHSPRTEERRLNVSSLRLDTVAAAAFGLSRSKALSAIEGRLVAVNSLRVEKPDYLLAPGDLITWQGRGKVRFRELSGATRKDRLWLIIDKFI